MLDGCRPWTGLLWGLSSFASVGTITAVWSNPYFTRMTPVGPWEFPLLVVMATLTGVFLAVRVQDCAARRAGVGGVISFIGIACPICNKILLLVFGGPLLLAYFEPIRPLVTVLGLALLLAGIARNMNLRRRLIAAPERI